MVWVLESTILLHFWASKFGAKTPPKNMAWLGRWRKIAGWKSRPAFFFSKTWSTWFWDIFSQPIHMWSIMSPRRSSPFQQWPRAVTYFCAKMVSLMLCLRVFWTVFFLGDGFKHVLFSPQKIEETIHFDEHICSNGFGSTRFSCFFFRTASDEFWSQHLPTKPLMNACEDWSRHGNPKNPLLMVQKSDCV